MGILQRRFRMDHAIFRSVEDCQDIHLDGAGPRVAEPTPGLSIRGRHSGGGMHYAWGYLCPAARRFFAPLRQTAPAPRSTFHLIDALWDTP